MAGRSSKSTAFTSRSCPVVALISKKSDSSPVPMANVTRSLSRSEVESGLPTFRPASPSAMVKSLPPVNRGGALAIGSAVTGWVSGLVASFPVPRLSVYSARTRSSLPVSSCGARYSTKVVLLLPPWGNLPWAVPQAPPGERESVNQVIPAAVSPPSGSVRSNRSSSPTPGSGLLTVMTPGSSTSATVTVTATLLVLTLSEATTLNVKTLSVSESSGSSKSGVFLKVTMPSVLMSKSPRSVPVSDHVIVEPSSSRAL